MEEFESTTKLSGDRIVFWGSSPNKVMLDDSFGHYHTRFMEIGYELAKFKRGRKWFFGDHTIKATFEQTK